MATYRKSKANQSRTFATPRGYRVPRTAKILAIHTAHRETLCFIIPHTACDHTLHRDNFHAQQFAHILLYSASWLRAVNTEFMPCKSRFK